MTIREHHYPTREALAEALATGVAAVLCGGIATRGQAVLAVSGGSTPKLFFRTLAKADLDWSRVTVCLVDERWVPETSDRSNTRLVRENLLTGPAASARLEPLFEEGASAREAEDEVSRRLAALPRPFDAVILGMGNDGHTASFFPGADRLAEAIDPQAGHRVLAIGAPGAGEPRITLALPFLLEARLLALHIEGDEKRETLQKALADGTVAEMPVRSVLRAPREEPLQVFWAP
ncbi:6-phosphogluconolactonase [Aureimonas phyllosphaerae]|uniref:6-phosphogluconolactonase n=1 Tax=Aureimonas phyllosphaerae TaxID=1166078 RepID=A0A7W6BQY7_9HYPH|nr:6-phosphogluconolactonase [Aureimonas phyllosphaerae]MBB3936456.1 6-phosphogluconolactonase [Aureimonas phyllosphaerae]MBB3960680.1 6-phosphogluconolactonase [Aureimonas phyllosphaerae]SFF30003.1 6-phosphogluconolactonase [Aureimonas phyllosphaerae]